MVAGVLSRLLPPWLDTEMAVTPGIDGPLGVVHPHDPLEHETGPTHSRRSHATSSQVGRASASTSRRHRRRSARLAGFGHVGCGSDREGGPCRAKSSSHRGRRIPSGAKRITAFRSICSGMVGCPGPTVETTIEGDDQPHRPGGPAPAPTEPGSGPVPPSRSGERLGIDRHHVLTDRLANELSPITVPGPGRHVPRHLALGVHGLDTGGGDEHRKRDGLAHHRGGQIRLSENPRCGAQTRAR